MRRRLATAPPRCGKKLFASLALVVLLAIAACAPRQPVEAPPPAPPPEVLAPVPEDEPDSVRSSRLDRFCNAVQRIVDAQASDFVAVRGMSLGGDAWSGAVVPEGLSGCTIDGGRIYSCVGPRMQRGNGTMLESSFNGFVADLDACFARAAWFPRNWHRGDVVQFAGIERQQVWRDLSTNPRPAVALNIEEDILARIYAIRFSVREMR
jgi:hypothetical protein